MTPTNGATNFANGDRRKERTDPRVRQASLFDPRIARELWESLPQECRIDRINKRNVPEIYRGAIRERSIGGRRATELDKRWTTVGLNYSELPETMRWEVAWLIYREVQLGRFINVNQFGAALRALRTAIGSGSDRARAARTLLHLSPEEWIHEVQYARLHGVEFGSATLPSALHRLSQLQDVLVYAYHQGEWWQLDVWNPYLDSRIPQRSHEPSGRSAVNFSNLTSPWLREGAKLWLSACLLSGGLSWSSVKARIDNLKWLQRHIDQYGDHGPLLTTDPHELRSFIKGLCDMLQSHRVSVGVNLGEPLGKNPRRNIMVGIEKFYQWMYDNRDEARSAHPDWAKLRADHCALFRPDDKPRLTNKRSEEPLALEDDVVRRIAEGCELLARPRNCWPSLKMTMSASSVLMTMH